MDIICMWDNNKFAVTFKEVIVNMEIIVDMFIDCYKFFEKY